MGGKICKKKLNLLAKFNTFINVHRIVIHLNRILIKIAFFFAF